MSQEFQNIKEKIEKEKPFLEKTYGVSAIGIFGSMARGEENPESDIDIVVEMNQEKIPVGLLGFARMKFYLEDLLGRNVDLITKNGIKPALRDIILRETIFI